MELGSSAVRTLVERAQRVGAAQVFGVGREGAGGAGAGATRLEADGDATVACALDPAVAIPGVLDVVARAPTGRRRGRRGRRGAGQWCAT